VALFIFYFRQEWTVWTGSTGCRRAANRYQNKTKVGKRRGVRVPHLPSRSGPSLAFCQRANPPDNNFRHLSAPSLRPCPNVSEMASRTGWGSFAQGMHKKIYITKAAATTTGTETAAKCKARKNSKMRKAKTEEVQVGLHKRKVEKSKRKKKEPKCRYLK